MYKVIFNRQIEHLFDSSANNVKDLLNDALNSYILINPHFDTKTIYHCLFINLSNNREFEIYL